VVSLQVAEKAKAPMVRVKEVRVVPGRGLEGDRYFNHAGTFSERPGTGRDVTLIELEAIEALERDVKIKLDPKDSRRNITTRGVPLNHLVGKEFRVGDALFRGIRLCEPCSHLETLTLEGVKAGLQHRGGLRAEILNEGIIRVGDRVQPAPSDSAKS